jgi:hypothetical protein
MRGNQCRQHVVGGVDGGVVAAGNHDGVRTGQRFEAVVGHDTERARGDLGLRPACQDVISRCAAGQLDASESLDRCGQVECDGVGQCQDGDDVHTGTIPGDGNILAICIDLANNLTDYQSVCRVGV